MLPKCVSALVLFLLCATCCALDGSPGNFLQFFSTGNSAEALKFVRDDAICEDKGPGSGKKMVQSWCNEVKRAGKVSITKETDVTNSQMASYKYGAKIIDMTRVEYLAARKEAGSKSFIIEFSVENKVVTANLYVFDQRGMLIFLADD